MMIACLSHVIGLFLEIEIREFDGKKNIAIAIVMVVSLPERIYQT